MPAHSVIVLGSINVDLVIRGPHLPAPGETVLGGTFYQASGGKGANQAVAAARAAPQPVAFVGAVGDDSFGRQLRGQLQSENLDCQHVRVVPNQATGVALILVDSAGQNCISVASGANHSLTPADIDALPSSLFETARVFLTNCETPDDTVLCALRRAHRAGLLTILNPAPASASLREPALLREVDVLTPNIGEAAALLQISPHECLSHPADAARALQALGCQSVIITLEAQGCLVLTPAGQAVHIAAHPVPTVDTTAAGDAFNGALAVALAEHGDLERAARWANAAAAISVTRAGAQPSLPRRTEIEALFKLATHR